MWKMWKENAGFYSGDLDNSGDNVVKKQLSCNRFGNSKLIPITNYWGVGGDREDTHHLRDVYCLHCNRCCAAPLGEYPGCFIETEEMTSPSGARSMTEEMRCVIHGKVPPGVTKKALIILKMLNKIT